MEENNNPYSDPRLPLVRAVVEIVSAAVTDEVKVQALVAFSAICGSAAPVNGPMQVVAGVQHLTTLCPREEWTADNGPVLWWSGAEDRPRVGTPDDADWPDWSGWYSHWTPLPMVTL